MSTSRRAAVARRALPWVGLWLGLRAAVAIGGWLVARRTDIGDESTATIRRTRTAVPLRLHPRHPALSRVRIDLVMTGGELDLTGLSRVDGGIDLTTHLTMAGLGVRVPAGWRVWWDAQGPGGIGLASTALAEHTDDERGADLRIHARLWFAGLGVEAPK
jgi:hypothetical protein